MSEKADVKETLEGTKDQEDSEHDPASPRHGPTLSTSTSSFEALDPHDPNLSRLADLMFSHTSSYLQGELGAVLEDYSLLTRMNDATREKYADLSQVAGSVGRSLAGLNAKYLALQPLLDQIDQIEASVASLEEGVYRLDAYARRLEERCKEVERRG